MVRRGAQTPLVSRFPQRSVSTPPSKEDGRGARTPMKTVGVLVSGRGSNLQALIDAQRAGTLGGAIVHFVEATLDSGPIVLQEAVPVGEDDTVERLSARILEAEHRIYPRAVRIVLEGRYQWDGRRVRVSAGA